MTHCAKCGAELIGSRKFCAACGHPSGDPRAPESAPGSSQGGASVSPLAISNLGSERGAFERAITAGPEQLIGAPASVASTSPMVPKGAPAVQPQQAHYPATPAPSSYAHPGSVQPMQPGAPMQPGGYGFAYASGSRVHVTWSNGHRYPGTVQQVSGWQCLVVFADGQQHWVAMQYMAPA